MPVTLTGKDAQGETQYFEAVPPNKTQATELDALRHLWARRRLSELEDRFRLNPSDANLREEMISLSCEHGVLSRLTALIAIDQDSISNPSGQVKTVVQPVEMPDQWAEGAFSQGFTGALPPPAPMFSPMPMPSPMPAAYPSAPPPYEAEIMMMEDLGSSPPRTRSAPPAKKGFKGLKNPFAKRAAAPPPMAEAKQERPSPAIIRPENGLSEAYSDLHEHCQALCQAIKAGSLPPAQALQDKRESLLKALTQSSMADRLPQLQRLLRRELLELQQGLAAPGIQAHQLLPLVEKILTMLAGVQTEWNTLFQTDHPATPFWESSI
jgi:hypothetical protein